MAKQYQSIEWHKDYLRAQEASLAQRHREMLTAIDNYARALASTTQHRNLIQAAVKAGKTTLPV